MAGGDVPVEAFARMAWKTNQNDETPSEPISDCSLDKLCLTVNPGDLHTIVLTGAHTPPH